MKAGYYIIKGEPDSSFAEREYVVKWHKKIKGACFEVVLTRNAKIALWEHPQGHLVWLNLDRFKAEAIPVEQALVDNFGDFL